jgi:hypothetical protein
VDGHSRVRRPGAYGGLPRGATGPQICFQEEDAPMTVGKTAAELEAMIMERLREHPACAWWLRRLAIKASGPPMARPGWASISCTTVPAR